MNVEALKADLLDRFYGIEGVVDLAEVLPVQLKGLSSDMSEFTLINKVIDLEIWLVEIWCDNSETKWNPKTETLREYLNSNYNAYGRVHSSRFYSNSFILDYIKSVK